MNSVIKYFLDKSIFLNLLTALILIIGAFKAITLNREAFPNINFDIVNGILQQLNLNDKENEEILNI
jgi:multidrug efflux pump subunit AcrB